MRRTHDNSGSGFTILEALVAIFLGVIILGTVTSLFLKAMDAIRVVSSRAEMQQNARAAVNYISRDISLAGAGLPVGGVQLPNLAPSRFAVDATGKVYVANNAYPSNNHMFAVIPNAAGGVVATRGGPLTDAITIVYLDATFPLEQFTITFPNGDGSAILATPPVLPPPQPLPALTDPAIGIKVGDLILLSNNAGGQAVAEVTTVAVNGTLTLADGDPLNINQSGAASGNVVAPAPGSVTTASRLLVVTYFIDVKPGPDGVVGTADDVPVLMRQVNAQVAVPVAENIENLQFTFDTFDDNTGTAQSNIKDVIAAGQSLNQIRKINLSVRARTVAYGHAAQQLELATSVSARNMSFRDRYN